jgi:alanine racemase
MAFTIVNTLEYSPILHLTNTSGIINYPEAAFNMVRSGIGLYGFGNDPEIDKHLKPIGTLKTSISQILELKEGDTVGYSRAFKAEGDITIATLPLGHADGIKRQFGNGRAGVLINGKYAPIVGNVCMDILMVNITGIECEEGDEVIVFGQENPASNMANNAGTISYELITGISQRVKRIMLNH